MMSFPVYQPKNSRYKKSSLNYHNIDLKLFKQ